MLLRLAELSDVEQAACYADNFITNDEESPWASRGGDYASWFVSELERRRGEQDEQSCCEHTYLLFADDSEDSELVGHIRVLNDPANESVRYQSGCFSYAVKPDWRGRGIGTQLLASGRFILRESKENLPVVCEDDNLAGVRTIEKNGAVFVGVSDKPNSSKKMRRYYCMVETMLPEDIEIIL